MTQFIVLHLN